MVDNMSNSQLDSHSNPFYMPADFEVIDVYILRFLKSKRKIRKLSWRNRDSCKQLKFGKKGLKIQIWLGNLSRCVKTFNLRSKNQKSLCKDINYDLEIWWKQLTVPLKIRCS